MSGFKRYKSKVFWDQMAYLDAAETEDNPIVHSPRPGNHEYESHEEEEEEDEEPFSRTEDTFDNGDITAIRVCPEILCKSGDRTKESNSSREDTNRCNSSMSQEFRSQDSGFSDTDRSNCSLVVTGEKEPPKKHRKRKKNNKERKLHPKLLGSLWLDESDFPERPAHSSTPKDIKRQLQSISINRKNETIILECESESLGDFLYAVEPVEDEPIGTQLQGTHTIGEAAVDWSYRRSMTLKSWLSDVILVTDDEPGAILENKYLPRRKSFSIISEEKEMEDLQQLSSLATAAANKLLIAAKQFDRDFHQIMRKIKHCLEGGKSEKEFLREIEDTTVAVLTGLGAPPPRRIQQGNTRSILDQLKRMKNYVDGTLDTRIDFYVERVVRGLEEAPKENSRVARGSLAALTALGLTGDRAGNSIARCSGIKALLTSLINARRTCNDFVAASLRALASVCCSELAIQRFVKEGGPEILTDILISETSLEREKMEATALAVQITAPWSNAIGIPYLEPFAETLIPALSDLTEITNCGETLLLTAAAFNQLSKSKRCVGVMLRCNTVGKLLTNVRHNGSGNIWLMEQVASLIGELARMTEARKHLAKARVSIALVCFLRSRPSGLEEAYRKLEITAATALTRLCVDPEIAKQVVALGGVDCLPNCDDEIFENQEDCLLKYTRSLRKACKKAAEQIDIAKAHDCSTFN